MHFWVDIGDVDRCARICALVYRGFREKEIKTLEYYLSLQSQNRRSVSCKCWTFFGFCFSVHPISRWWDFTESFPSSPPWPPRWWPSPPPPPPWGCSPQPARQLYWRHFDPPSCFGNMRCGRTWNVKYVENHFSRRPKLRGTLQRAQSSWCATTTTTS